MRHQELYFWTVSPQRHSWCCTRCHTWLRNNEKKMIEKFKPLHTWPGTGKIWWVVDVIKSPSPIPMWERCEGRKYQMQTLCFKMSWAYYFLETKSKTLLFSPLGSWCWIGSTLTRTHNIYTWDYRPSIWEDFVFYLFKKSLKSWSNYDHYKLQSI